MSRTASTLPSKTGDRILLALLLVWNTLAFLILTVGAFAAGDALSYFPASIAFAVLAVVFHAYRRPALYVPIYTDTLALRERLLRALARLLR